MKKNVVFLAMVFIASTTLLLTGCQNDDTPNVEQVQQIDPRVLKLSSDPIVQKELIFMKEKMGYNLSKVYILKGEASGSYGIVEGWDAIEIPRTQIQESMKRNLQGENSELNARHRINSTMSSSGVKGIRVLAGVPAVWSTAIDAGRTAWNGLGKTLSFSAPTSGSYSSGKVNVSYVDLSTLGYPSDVIASGTSPVGSTIGTYLRINSNCTYPSFSSLSNSQRKYLMAHELGHVIGFLHTDTYSGLALTTTNYACSNTLDSSSILKPGSDPVPSWSGFSTCDQDAFDWFYGKSVA